MQMTVAQLTEELTKRNVEVTNKHKKKQLQTMLRTAVKNSILRMGDE
jgi:hypothetical protein